MNGPVMSESIGLPAGYRIEANGEVFAVRGRALKRLKRGVGSHGYPTVVIVVDGKSRSMCIHRLLAMAFIPNPMNKPQVNHRDGDKANFDLSNLEWVTDSENKLHAYANGLMAVTETKRAASRENAKKMHAARRKFSLEDRESMKRRKAGGESYRAIAKDFACDHTTIRDVCIGVSYPDEGLVAA